MNEDNQNAAHESLSKISSNIRSALIQECLKLNFQNPKTKISNESADLVGKVAKILAIETSMRAANLTKAENKAVVSLDHVEMVLPQIMLDFP